MTSETQNYLQVIDRIYERLMTTKLSDNIGLHSGTSGMALFFVYYGRIIQNKNETNCKIMDILEHNIQSIDSGNRNHTICNGISGFAWLCEHLKKLGVLNQEHIAFLDDMDPFLCNQMIADMGRGRYDYLHGALGPAIYFLSRFNKKETLGYMSDLLTQFEKTGVSCENGGVKWSSVLDYKTGETGYNISLSHGMSSIAAFLIRLYQLNFETVRVERMLKKTIAYIFDQIIYTENNIAYFPSYSKESSPGAYYSRLGWCYGDLGIAYVLWKAGVMLKTKEWENVALRILHHTCGRRDLKINAVGEAAFCHGSAEIAHIFWNLYAHTQIQQFKNTTDYWLNITLQMMKYNDGLAEFKTHKEESAINSYCLLTGVAGIGLTLLSYLNKREIAWDESLLLT